MKKFFELNLVSLFLGKIHISPKNNSPFLNSKFLRCENFSYKKILSGIALCAFLAQGSLCFAQTLEDVFQEGVDAYRKGDIQECCDTMRSLKKKDPTNSYIIYYLAMSNAKLGDVDEAKKNYEEVILLNQDSQLVSYSKEGVQNIENALGNKKEDKKESLTKKVSRDIDKPSVSQAEGVDKKASVSDEEVAKAIKTLREAGLLNVNLGVASSPVATDPTLMQQNSELMNLNMMMGTMGGSGKSSGMDMLPFLMMQQGANGGNSKISPEVIQMMMNNSMLDSMSAFDVSNKDK